MFCLNRKPQKKLHQNTELRKIGYSVKIHYPRGIFNDSRKLRDVTFCDGKKMNLTLDYP
jgi:hypothetical protein